jgi:hypothetical protein
MTAVNPGNLPVIVDVVGVIDYVITGIRDRRRRCHGPDSYANIPVIEIFLSM